MKCKKCKTNNITKAIYCKKCGNEFLEDERKKARRKTFIGKIERIEDIYNTITLSKITSHILFKIFTILIVLGIGIYFWISNGISLKLLNSEYYDIKYYEKEHEYYLVTEFNEVTLNLYIPNRLQNINIIHYNKDGQKIEENTYLKDEEIILYVSNEDYYVIDSLYLKNKKEEIKLYVLKI